MERAGVDDAFQDGAALQFERQAKLLHVDGGERYFSARM
jgi:hypothetical protein